MQHKKDIAESKAEREAFGNVVAEQVQAAICSVDMLESQLQACLLHHTSRGQETNLEDTSRERRTTQTTPHERRSTGLVVGIEGEAESAPTSKAMVNLMGDVAGFCRIPVAEFDLLHTRCTQQSDCLSQLAEADATVRRECEATLTRMQVAYVLLPHISKYDL